MSNGVKIELNQQAIKEELLKAPWIQSVCEDYAKQICSSAGSGYEVDTYIGKNRVNASVHAATKRAKRDNMKNNTLLKALGSIKK